MTAESAKCDKLDGAVDDLMESCKVEGKFLCSIFTPISDQFTSISLYAHCLNIILHIHLDLDKKLCHNLDVTLENDDEHKKYGGDYQYIGTVELRDDSEKIYPFYKQMSPARGFSPLYMYHSGEMLIATVQAYIFINAMSQYKIISISMNDFIKIFDTCKHLLLIH